MSKQAQPNPLLAAAKSVPSSRSEKMTAEEIRQVKEVAEAVVNGTIAASATAIWRQVIREKLLGKCSRERWLGFIDEARAEK